MMKIEIYSLITLQIWVESGILEKKVMIEEKHIATRRRIYDEEIHAVNCCSCSLL